MLNSCEKRVKLLSITINVSKNISQAELWIKSTETRKFLKFEFKVGDTTITDIQAIIKRQIKLYKNEEIYRKSLPEKILISYKKKS
jgi:hypothetical protein